MKNYIICLNCDNKRVKHIVMSMINYIFNKGVCAANYMDYLEYKDFDNSNLSSRTIRPIDKYIDIFCNIYGIERRIITDEILYNNYFCINTKGFKDRTDVSRDIKKNPDAYKIIDFDELSTRRISDIYEENANKDKLVYISMFDIFRELQRLFDNIEDNLIDDSIIRDAINIAEQKHVCIVYDVEGKDIKKRIGSIKTNSLYGECVTIKYDELIPSVSNNINNVTLDLQDKSLMMYFYIILNYCQTLNRK